MNIESFINEGHFIIKSFLDAGNGIYLGVGGFLS